MYPIITPVFASYESISLTAFLEFIKILVVSLNLNLFFSNFLYIADESISSPLIFWLYIPLVKKNSKFFPKKEANSNFYSSLFEKYEVLIRRDKQLKNSKSYDDINQIRTDETSKFRPYINIL